MPKHPPVIISQSLIGKEGARRDQLAKAAQALQISYGDAFLLWVRWLSFRSKHTFDRVTPENIHNQPSHLRLMARDVDQLVGHSLFAEKFCEIGWLQEVDGIIFSSQEAINIQQKTDEAREKRRQKTRIKGSRPNTRGHVGLKGMMAGKKSRVAN